MMFEQKTIWLRWLLVILLFILMGACNVPQSPTSSLHIQEIIPADKQPFRWYLSPEGENLLYNTLSSEWSIVYIVNTGQEVKVENCRKSQWLNEQSIYCYDTPNHPPTVVTIRVSDEADNVSRNMIQPFNAEEQDLHHLLDQAEAIYKLPNFVLVLSRRVTENTPVYYQVKRVVDWNMILADYSFVTVSLTPIIINRLSIKAYSPDKQYYYIKDKRGSSEDANLKIYEATNDEPIAEVKIRQSAPHFLIGGSYPNETKGWGADNGGVYFQLYYGGGGFTGPAPPIEPILKLVVPQ